MSLMHATFGITYGVGLLFIGAIGDLINLHVAFATGAVIGVSGFWLLTLRARNWRAAIDGVVAPAELQLASS